MIDWHSHVLPAMDDGSRNVKESIALLKRLNEQGVDTVIATPHFYANDESVDAFLARRRQAYENLSAQRLENEPRIRLGAEVRYYPGISRMENLTRLCIEGTKLLLLEMPTSEWTEYTVRELLEMASTKGVTLILAHVERVLPLQRKRTLDTLVQNGVLMQINAAFLDGFFSKRKALKLLKAGSVQFVGSDCHGLKTRPPEMDKAFQIVKEKLGSRFLKQMNEYGQHLLVENK